MTMTAVNDAILRSNEEYGEWYASYHLLRKRIRKDHREVYKKALRQSKENYGDGDLGFGHQELFNRSYMGEALLFLAQTWGKCESDVQEQLFDGFIDAYSRSQG